MLQHTVYNVPIKRRPQFKKLDSYVPVLFSELRK